jgi:hypothetical protein
MVVHELAHGFYEDIAIFLTLTLIAGLIGFFRNVRTCLNKQSARTLRLSKAMELLAREIDKQTNLAHKDVKSDLESNVDTILKDDKGNL